MSSRSRKPRSWEGNQGANRAGLLVPPTRKRLRPAPDAERMYPARSSLTQQALCPPTAEDRQQISDAAAHHPVRRPAQPGIRMSTVAPRIEEVGVYEHRNLWQGLRRGLGQFVNISRPPAESARQTAGPRKEHPQYSPAARVLEAVRADIHGFMVPLSRKAGVTAMTRQQDRSRRRSTSTSTRRDPRQDRKPPRIGDQRRPVRS